jgi:hypothetical protein
MKRAIVIAAAITSATSVAAQDVYIVPCHEESHAAARQQALLNEQMRLMEAQRKVLEAQARANNGTHPQMPQWMQDMGRDQAAVYCSGGRSASGAQRYADCKAWFPTVTGR